MDLLKDNELRARASIRTRDAQSSLDFCVENWANRTGLSELQINNKAIIRLWQEELNNGRRNPKDCEESREQSNRELHGTCEEFDFPNSDGCRS